MFNLHLKKVRGRPKGQKTEPNVANMRITQRLKDLIESEMTGRETMSECCLRLLREKGKKVGALEQELQLIREEKEKNLTSNSHYVLTRHE